MHSYQCMQAWSADGGATFDGNGLMKWNGDCVLKLIVPFDLSGPDTLIGHCCFSLNVNVKENYYCFPNLMFP